MSKDFMGKCDDPGQQHTIFCNMFLATQTCQETSLNLEQFIGGAPCGVFAHGGKIWWPPERTVMTQYATTNNLGPGSAHVMGVYRIAQAKNSMFSFSLDVQKLRVSLIKRSNSLSEDCSVEDFRAQMTLNSDYLSVNGFYGALSSGNTAGLLLRRGSEGQDFFKEELEVTLSIDPRGQITGKDLTYKWDMSDFGRDFLNRAMIETYGVRSV
jgi:hypothetical protein